MKIVSVAEMGAIEQAAIQAGVTIPEMMARAGEGVARAIQKRWDVQGKQILVLAGPGHNGGDGLVAGRHLAEAGAEVKVYLLKPRPEDDALLAQVRERGLFVADAEFDQRWRVLHQLVTHADFLVDALVGTGARLPLADKLGQLLDQVGRALKDRAGAETEGLAVTEVPAFPARPIVVAVDCPSGLDCDTGALDEKALRADLTVTMAFPKRGMFRGAGVAACGALVVVDIGLPPKLKVVSDIPLELITAEWVRARLPARPADAHKDTFGRVLIVAGSVMYTGAVALAGEGAFRVGAGLVRLGIPLPLHGPLANRLPEATFLPLPHDRGVLTEEAAGLVRKELGPYKALLVGSGLGQEDSTARFIDEFFVGHVAPKKGRFGFPRPSEVKAVVEDAPDMAPLPPLVVDADGLNLLAKLEDWPRRLPAETVLTPHPGEMSRLLGVDKQEIQADRLAVAARAAREWGHVVVLKGAYTVVAAPDGRTLLAPWANPGLARAGTGDVLAGAIVGLLGQGLSSFDAAACGVYLHGLAGHLATAELGPAGVLASDVARHMAHAVRSVAGV